SPFDAADIDEVIRNLLNPGVLLRSHPSKIVARWKRYVRAELFRVYFFDDLERNPAELRRSIVKFLGADPEKPSGRLKADHNRNASGNKLRLTTKVRSRIAQFFEQELKACAVELGGPARQWPARYGFSLLFIFWQLADDLDLFLWCDWMKCGTDGALRSPRRHIAARCPDHQSLQLSAVSGRGYSLRPRSIRIKFIQVFFRPAAKRMQRLNQRSTQSRERVFYFRRNDWMNSALHQAVAFEAAQRLGRHFL